MNCDIYQHLTFLEIGNCNSDGHPLIVFGDLTERKKAHYRELMKKEMFGFQMEKYSKHLEQIVAERTNDLTIEKQRTDRLLYSGYLVTTLTNFSLTFLFTSTLKFSSFQMITNIPLLVTFIYNIVTVLTVYTIPPCQQFSKKLVEFHT